MVSSTGTMAVPYTTGVIETRTGPRHPATIPCRHTNRYGTFPGAPAHAQSFLSCIRYGCTILVPVSLKVYGLLGQVMVEFVGCINPFGLVFHSHTCRSQW